MKLFNLKQLSILTMSVFSSFTFASSGNELTGDTRTACEVILCLSSSQRPAECNSPITKYFSIKRYSHGSFSLSKTIKARKDFLKLCPASDADNSMETLAEAISKQENLCKAEEINKIIETKYIPCGSDCEPSTYYRTTTTLPEYCAILSNHEYTNLQLPRYTCGGEYYKKKDWSRGYQNGAPIKRTCWVD